MVVFSLWVGGCGGGVGGVTDLKGESILKCSACICILFKRQQLASCCVGCASFCTLAMLYIYVGPKEPQQTAKREDDVCWCAGWVGSVS